MAEPTLPAADPAPLPPAEADALEEGHHPHGTPHGRYLLLLSLTALGVVYGDIGTSPLYAMREVFHGHYGIPVTPANVLGILSLIFWALVLIISIKYLGIVMRADNRGEGGILALLALIRPKGEGGTRRRRRFLMVMALFGAALLYGDGMITPAITVMSAMEGLTVATSFFEPYVLPLVIAILLGLFFIQRHGTAGIGRIFGPVMAAWFVVIALLGIRGIVQYPQVLAGLNPLYGVEFFIHNRGVGFLALGSVFLVVTGGEALYADMGHFGIRPIRLAWFCLVLPALLLNYFGQGALLIGTPEAAENPFYRLAPAWALYPLVALATVAASIASQAVISGAFSVTRQAVQLGYCPRLDIEHTSAHAMGQIYVPAVNWALMIACIGLVLGFRSSSNLAAAYGVAVTTDMVFTAILLFVVQRELWGWKLLPALLLTAFFLTIDLSFWAANIVKVPHGGWFPLVVAALVFTVMKTWKDGRAILGQRIREGSLPLDLFLKDVKKHPPLRVPGTAVFMTGNREVTPPALLHNLKHNKVLHERVVILSVSTAEVPHVPSEERLDVNILPQGFYQVSIRCGFMETPDVPHELARLRIKGLTFRRMETTYFLGRERILATQRPGMMLWRERLFAWISQNSRSATFFFNLPPERVVELGAQIEL